MGLPKLVTMQVVFQISMEGVWVWVVGVGLVVVDSTLGLVRLVNARRSLGTAFGRYHAVDIFDQ